MYHVSAQGVDEHMINVHHYYYKEYLLCKKKKGGRKMAFYTQSTMTVTSGQVKNDTTTEELH